ncbi:MAG: carboxypeptidase regulatory-like domain-containing protein [Thermoanaerobaculia bacterium]|nr:carboxypeptidase regulatory-like domain-containing protein [Thermoanaerobaculia bacterium]
MRHLLRIVCASLFFLIAPAAFAAPHGPMGTLRGTVVDANSSAPIAGATVRLHDNLNQFLASTETAGDGSYEFVAPPARYFVFAVAPGHIGQIFTGVPCATDAVGVPLCSLLVGTGINLDSNEIFAANFALTPGGGVSGTIRDEATGQPLAGAPVLLWITGGALSFRSTDSLGHYEFFAVLPGNHHLTTSHTAAGYLDESYPDTLCPTGVPFDCNPSSGSPFPVTAGSITTLQDMSLRTRVVFDDGFETGDTSAWSLVP